MQIKMDIGNSFAHKSSGIWWQEKFYEQTFFC